MSIYDKAIETVAKLKENSVNNSNRLAYLNNLHSFLTAEKRIFGATTSVDDSNVAKEIEALKNAILHDEKTHQPKKF